MLLDEIDVATLAYLYYYRSDTITENTITVTIPNYPQHSLSTTLPEKRKVLLEKIHCKDESAWQHN